MSIVIKRFHQTKSAVAFLEDLALWSNDTFIFRGHSKADYRLSSTWHRENKVLTGNLMGEVDVALNRFKVGMEKLGLACHDHENRFEALEHGRHFGIPTPCIDFTYSPYVALFFAFNGVRKNWKSKKNSYSAVYALNVKKLAFDYAKKLVPDISEKENEDKRSEVYLSFLKPKDDLFLTEYPAGVLQFIPYPSSTNLRMQRQLGALLYDSLIYYCSKIRDLEDYIGSLDESQIVSEAKPEPVMYKVLINHNCVSEVFHRLELMNITGGHLYNSGDGVAMDIHNFRNYNPKFSYLRDIKLPRFDRKIR